MKKTLFILSILSCLLLNAQNDFTPREAEMLSKPIAFLGYDFGMMYFNCFSKIGLDSIILAKHSKSWSKADDIISKGELELAFRHKPLVFYPTYLDSSLEQLDKNNWIFYEDSFVSDATILAHIQQRYINLPKEEFAVALLFHAVDCKEHTAEVSLVYIDVVNNKVLRIVRNYMRTPNQSSKIKAGSESMYFGYSGFYAFLFHEAYRGALLWHEHYFNDLRKYKKQITKN